MAELGTIVSISATGKLVVRSKDIPAIGSVVEDGGGRNIGKIAGVIGPTRNPFILIEKNAAEDGGNDDAKPETYIGRRVFLMKEGKK